VGVALLGCGRIARGRHLPILAASSAWRVIAVVDPDPAARQTAGGQVPGCRVEPDAQSVLADADVQAVVIASPNTHHARQARLALDAGKHVYLEKPIALDVADARGLVDAWRDTKLVGRVGFNYRFHPMHQAARDAIAAGRIGPLVAIRSQFSTPATEQPGWKQRRETGGGALLDLASHHVDLARFLTGKDITRTRGWVRSRRSEHDTAGLELTLGEGVLAQITVAMSSVDEDRIEVLGEDGSLVLDRVADPVMRHRPAGRGGLRWQRLKHALTAARPTLPGSGRFEVSTRRSLEQFAAAVRGETSATPDLADGLACLEVLAAAEADAGVAMPEGAG
jgi:myo-inositol 2-dehydrogenase/D-chiro-inositol 1-dehydrogenase